MVSLELNCHLNVVVFSTVFSSCVAMFSFTILITGGRSRSSMQISAIIAVNREEETELFASVYLSVSPWLNLISMYLNAKPRKEPAKPKKSRICANGYIGIWRGLIDAPTSGRCIVIIKVTTITVKRR